MCQNHFFSLFFFVTYFHSLGAKEFDGTRHCIIATCGVVGVLIFSCLCMLNRLLSLEAKYPRCEGEVPEGGGNKVIIFLTLLKISRIQHSWTNRVNTGRTKRDISVNISSCRGLGCTAPWFFGLVEAGCPVRIRVSTQTYKTYFSGALCS